MLSMTRMVSLIKPVPLSGSKGMSVPNSTWSEPKKAKPHSVAGKAPKKPCPHKTFENSR